MCTKIVNTTLKERLIKLPVLILVGLVGSLILYVFIPSALERDLNSEKYYSIEWMLYTPSDNSFTIELPGLPKVEANNASINGNQVLLTTFVYEIHNEYLFTIGKGKVSEELIIEDENEALLDSLDGILMSHKDSKLEDYLIYSLGDLPAIKFFIRHKNDSYWTRGVVVLDHDKKYILQYYNRGVFDEGSYEHFINSFNVTK